MQTHFLCSVRNTDKNKEAPACCLSSINQSCIFRVVRVIKSLQHPLEVGNNLTRINDNVREQGTHTHTRFNGLLSGTTWVSRYQKGKVNLHFTEARDSKWQWHQLGRMQVCTALQTDNHASTQPLSFTGRMPFLPPNQQRQSTENHWF